MPHVLPMWGKPCCLRASNMRIPAATETLKESTCPAAGMLTRKSHFSRTRRCMPAPSLPMTMQTFPLRSRLSVLCPSASAPNIQNPLLLQQLERAGDVRHHGEGNVLACPGGHLGHRLAFLRGAAGRDDDELHPELVRGTEDGAEVLRVGDAVQDEDEALLPFQVFQVMLQAGLLRGGRPIQDEERAAMRLGTAQPGQLRVLDLGDGDALLLRELRGSGRSAALSRERRSVPCPRPSEALPLSNGNRRHAQPFPQFTPKSRTRSGFPLPVVSRSYLLHVLRRPSGTPRCPSCR